MKIAYATGMLQRHPVIAILRGVLPKDVLAVSSTLMRCGMRVIEVPLNSPNALESIALLYKYFGKVALIGAGTVLSIDDVEAAAIAGATLILSPNRNVEVIQRTRQLGLYSMPGVATPSEGFEAIAAGANALKLFPLNQDGPSVVKAWRAVFPRDFPLYAVGGVNSENIEIFKDCGVSGVGVGSALYKPGVSLHQLRRRADEFIYRWSECGD